MRRLFVGVLVILFALSVGGLGLCAEKKLPLADTPEWVQLSRLWRQMSEHWTGKVFSQEKFEALGDEIEAALPSLDRLEQREYFSHAMRVSLEELLQYRYLFIRDQRYRPTGSLVLMDLESHAFSARSRVEDLLTALQWPPEVPGVSSGKIKEKARKDLAGEMEFLKRATALQKLIAQHRAQAEKRQAEDAPVDWNQFTLEAQQRTQALIGDYLAGRLKPDKETLQLQRLALSLTEEGGK